MQSPGWYYRRARSMAPGEIAWRLHSALRTAADRYRVATGSFGPHRAPALALHRAPLSVPLCDVEPGAWTRAAPDNLEAEWLRAVTSRADRIAGRGLDLFQMSDVPLGDPIDWNRDHESGRPAPLTFAPSIDYRVHAVTGDAKMVWEPNRHHQFVVLGRAYRASGDVRYAAAAVAQMTSWLDQCPPGRGMNWRSPLELAIRAINWVWTLALIEPSGVVTPELQGRVLSSLDVHVWDIARKYSRGSSANNHRIGEAAGVFIACRSFPGLTNAPRLAETARGILAEEIALQTYADGCTREQAFGYHLFVAQFLLLAGIVARRAGSDFSAEFWRRLEWMIEFAATMTEAGALPAVGDGDDGYVLDLDNAPRDPAGLFACGAVLFDRPDLARAAGRHREAARWLLGAEGQRRLAGLVAQPFRAARAPDGRPEGLRYERRAVSTQVNTEVGPGGEFLELQPRAFTDSGYYLLQHGRAASRDAVSVLFDCGDLGFGPLAAHGHADALSFTLRALGGDVLIDPGTYDYFTYPAWREYFRSTRAHNTLSIDGLDQSVRTGPFMWDARAHARCLAWTPDGECQRVIGEHDGYTRLEDPVSHRRTLDLDTRAGRVTIADDVSMKGTHAVALHFHFADRCELVDRAEGRFVLAAGHGRVILTLPPGLRAAAIRGPADPVGGWASSRYHEKRPVWTVSGAATLTGTTRLVTTIEIESDGR